VAVRFLLPILLLLSVTPGVAEVAESAVHLIVHGDLAHHDDEAAADGCGEHTCTPLAHHCGCHSAMAGQVATRVTTHDFCDVTRIDPNAVAAVFGRACEPPPLRPPIG
jgi:hypothetical protein